MAIARPLSANRASDPERGGEERMSMVTQPGGIRNCKSWGFCSNPEFLSGVRWRNSKMPTPQNNLWHLAEVCLTMNVPHTAWTAAFSKFIQKGGFDAVRQSMSGEIN